MMYSDDEKRKILINAGWRTTFTPTNWYNPKLVVDVSLQDYLDYPMTLDQAYDYEMNPDSRPFSNKQEFLEYLFEFVRHRQRNAVFNRAISAGVISEKQADGVVAMWKFLKAERQRSERKGKPER